MVKKLNETLTKGNTMKKTLLLAAMILGSSVAMASGKLHFKASYLNQTSKTGSTETGSSYFNPDVVLGDFQGKLGESDFRLLLDFVSLHGGTNAQFINEAWIAKTIGNMKYTLGKVAVNAGGFENGYIAVGGTHLVSLANSGGLVTTPANNFGFGMDVMMGDHTIGLQALNQTNTATPAAGQRRHSLGLQYKGSFADKMFSVMAGQFAGAEDAAGTGNSLTQTFFGVSVKATDALSIDLENITNSKKAATSGAVADTTSSMILEAKYAMGVYTPVFKYESSENKDDENAALATSKKRTGMSLAVDIKPDANEAFNYYVGYNMVTDKPGNTGATDTTDNKLFAGLKFTGDLLK
jgi:hypothetical protein